MNGIPLARKREARALQTGEEYVITLQSSSDTFKTDPS